MAKNNGKIHYLFPEVTAHVDRESSYLYLFVNDQEVMRFPTESHLKPVYESIKTYLRELFQLKGWGYQIDTVAEAVLFSALVECWQENSE